MTSAGVESAAGSSDHTWLISGAASDYDVRATLNSGALSTGTVGAWLNLGTSRNWSCSTDGSV